jgi:hypothetical protein
MPHSQNISPSHAQQKRILDSIQNLLQVMRIKCVLRKYSFVLQESPEIAHNFWKEQNQRRQQKLKDILNE